MYYLSDTYNPIGTNYRRDGQPTPHRLTFLHALYLFNEIHTLQYNVWMIF